MSAVHIIKKNDEVFEVNNKLIRVIGTEIIDKSQLSFYESKALQDFVNKVNSGIRIDSTITK